MPHNYEHVGLIALLFPNATIIHCSATRLTIACRCYECSSQRRPFYNTDLGKLAAITALMTG
jgi:hypothetical protein